MKTTSNRWGCSTIPQRTAGASGNDQVEVVLDGSEEVVLDGSSDVDGRVGRGTKRDKVQKPKRKSPNSKKFGGNNRKQPSTDLSVPGGTSAQPFEIKQGVERLLFRSGRGYIDRTSDTTARITVEYTVRSAVNCPCPDEACNGLVKVGRYGECGDGSRVCLHCRKAPLDGAFYNSTAALARHVGGARCRGKQIVDPERSALNELGELLCYEISNPLNAQHVRQSGEVVKMFVCPKCAARTLWSIRFRHAHHCYPRHGVNLPGTTAIEVLEADDFSEDVSKGRQSGQVESSSK